MNMKREIKFRGKSLIHNKWIYGGLAEDRHDNAVILPKNNWQKGGCVDKDTIGQFTGIHDSRGVEVYEFDIIKDEGSEQLYVMYFSEKDLRFVRCPIIYFTKAHEDEKEYNSCATTLEWWNRIKRYVVGNIHDNPERIKEEKK